MRVMVQDARTRWRWSPRITVFSGQFIAKAKPILVNSRGMAQLLGSMQLFGELLTTVRSSARAGGFAQVYGCDRAGNSQRL